MSERSETNDGVHNEFGQIANDDIARDMAEAEKPGREEASRIENEAVKGLDPREEARKSLFKRKADTLHLRYHNDDQIIQAQYDALDALYNRLGRQVLKRIIWGEDESGRKMDNVSKACAYIYDGFRGQENAPRMLDYALKTIKEHGFHTPISQDYEPVLLGHFTKLAHSGKWHELEITLKAIARTRGVKDRQSEHNTIRDFLLSIKDEIAGTKANPEMVGLMKRYTNLEWDPSAKRYVPIPEI